MAMTDNLISYYNFEEAAGDLIDQHGTNDGTNDGADYQATGIINYGWDFEADNTDFVDLGNSFTFTDKITVSAWINPESGATNMDIASKYDGGADDWVLYTTTTDLIIFAVFVGGVAKLATYTHGSALEAAGWFHVVGVYDGTNVHIYINGSLEDSTPASGNITTSADNVYIGTRLSAGNDFDGIIDEVGIWNRDLDSTDATTLWNGGAGLAYPFAAPAVGNLHMMGANF